jgi:hypothetical protein
MDDMRMLNKRYETVAWGVSFILLGVVNWFRGLPNGAGALGIGMILLGLNAARYLSKIPTSGFTIILGVIALVFGAAEVLRDLLKLQIDVPFFPLLLIVIGVIWLIRGVTRST